VARSIARLDFFRFPPQRSQLLLATFVGMFRRLGLEGIGARRVMFGYRAAICLQCLRKTAPT